MCENIQNFHYKCESFQNQQQVNRIGVFHRCSRITGIIFMLYIDP